MKLLIIFLSGIGNFILFTPTLRAIRNKYPHAKITLLAKQKVVLDIVQNEGLIDHFIHYPQTTSPLVQASLTYSLRRIKFDTVITTFDAQGWKLSMLALMTGGKCSIGYRTGRWYDRCYDKLLTYDTGMHEVDRHLKIADYMGADVTDKTPVICINEEDREFAKAIIPHDSSLLIGMHPGSSENLWRKRWMPERFAELADCLSNKYGAKIIIFGGAGEVQLAQKISTQMKIAKPENLTGKTTLMQTAAIIERCTLFITNDSGLMHVAAAVKTPVVAIFGPTDPAKNYPIGEGHIVIRKDLPCSPCLTYDKDECDSPECLKAVKVEDVLCAVESILIPSVYQ